MNTSMLGTYDIYKLYAPGAQKKVGLPLLLPYYKSEVDKTNQSVDEIS